ncbi:Hypothetical predicted protein [Marmota monax]|uniref:Uncharacterized protein n=1 Tax=Marmota monax TaxID=9995 RepID=A0A5E4AS57_MARMO|nr:hypothetical protein GHT09_010970 [Marmota monax]VTJ59352.1 Hypothetical predicted protein [Marmota monax]
MACGVALMGGPKRPQGQAYCTRFISLCVVQKPQCSPAMKGYCQQNVGSGGDEMRAMLEPSHQTLLLQQCSVPTVPGPGTLSLTRQQETATSCHRSWERSNSSVGQAQLSSICGEWKVARTASPGPSAPTRLPCYIFRGHLTCPSPDCSKQVSLLHQDRSE